MDLRPPPGPDEVTHDPLNCVVIAYMYLLANFPTNLICLLRLLMRLRCQRRQNGLQRMLDDLMLVFTPSEFILNSQ